MTEQSATASTDPNSQDNMLQPRTWGVSREQVIDCIESTFSTEKGWNIENVDRFKGEVRLKHKPGLFAPLNHVLASFSQLDTISGKKTTLSVRVAPDGGKGKIVKSQDSIRAFLKIVDLNMRAWTRNR